MLPRLGLNKPSNTPTAAQAPSASPESVPGRPLIGSCRQLIVTQLGHVWVGLDTGTGRVLKALLGKVVLGAFAEQPVDEGLGSLFVLAVLAYARTSHHQHIARVTCCGEAPVFGDAAFFVEPMQVVVVHPANVDGAFVGGRHLGGVLGIAGGLIGLNRLQPFLGLLFTPCVAECANVCVQAAVGGRPSKTTLPLRIGQLFDALGQGFFVEFLAVVHEHPKPTTGADPLAFWVHEAIVGLGQQ